MKEAEGNDTGNKDTIKIISIVKNWSEALNW
jgi:hypothetical protein